MEQGEVAGVLRDIVLEVAAVCIYRCNLHTLQFTRDVCSSRHSSADHVMNMLLWLAGECVPPSRIQVRSLTPYKITHLLIVAIGRFVGRVNFCLFFLPKITLLLYIHTVITGGELSKG